MLRKHWKVIASTEKKGTYLKEREDVKINIGAWLFINSESLFFHAHILKTQKIYNVQSAPNILVQLFWWINVHTLTMLAGIIPQGESLGCSTVCRNEFCIKLVELRLTESYNSTYTNIMNKLSTWRNYFWKNTFQSKNKTYFKSQLLCTT